VDLIERLPKNLDFLDWDMGNESVDNESVLINLFLKRPSLTHLLLRFRNEIVVETLRRALPYAADTLQVLDLRGNLLGDDGVSSLIESFEEARLKSLNLGFNNIGDMGAERLATILASPECSLTHLDLNSNFIGDHGAHSIAHSLQENRKSVLEKLIMYGNARISSSCGPGFIDCLISNTALKTLNLQRTQLGINEDIMKRLDFFLRMNQCGRKILKCVDDVQPGVWAPFLANHCSHRKDALFYFLSEIPLLSMGQTKDTF